MGRRAADAPAVARFIAQAEPRNANLTVLARFRNSGCRKRCGRLCCYLVITLVVGIGAVGIGAVGIGAVVGTERRN